MLKISPSQQPQLPDEGSQDSRYLESLADSGKALQHSAIWWRHPFVFPQSVYLKFSRSQEQDITCQLWQASCSGFINNNPSGQRNQSIPYGSPESRLKFVSKSMKHLAQLCRNAYRKK
jgi:hypothetical protein